MSPPLSRNRNFLFLAAANLVSQFGDRLTHMGLIALVAQLKPRSALAFSTLALFFALPVILWGLPSGYLADRVSRKTLLLLGDAARLALLALLAIRVFHRDLSLPLLYGFVFFVFLFGAMFNISRNALIPELVGPAQLLRANALLTLIARVATVSGTVLGGILVDRLGAAPAFGINALTYGLSFGLVLGIHPPALQRSPERRAPGRTLREGLQEAVHNPPVRAVLLTVVFLAFLASLSYTLLVPYVQQWRRLGTEGVGILGGLLAAGMFLGAAFTGVGIKDAWAPWVLALAFGILGLGVAAVPQVHHPEVLYGGTLLAGGLAAVVAILQDTLLQKHARNEALGKVFGLKEILLSGVFLLSSFGLASLADLWGMEPTLLVAGLLLLTLGAVTLPLCLRAGCGRRLFPE